MSKNRNKVNLYSKFTQEEVKSTPRSLLKRDNETSHVRSSSNQYSRGKGNTHDKVEMQKHIALAQPIRLLTSVLPLTIKQPLL